MADDGFDHPRIAAIYDALDGDRSDLEAYVQMAEERGARRVLDVGCGTGTFALLLADRGLEVTGVDPALASLEVARTKPGSDRVRWIHGDATSLPPLQVDLATMTGNVAQAIVEREDWDATLRGIHGSSTTRTIDLIRGEQTVRFQLRRRAGVVLRFRLTLPAGTQARLTGRISGVAGVAMSTSSADCRSTVGKTICTQSVEWCPLPAGTWRFQTPDTGWAGGQGPTRVRSRTVAALIPR